MFIVLIEFTVTNYIWMEKCQFLVGVEESYSFITWLEGPQGSCLKIKWTKFDIS